MKKRPPFKVSGQYLKECREAEIMVKSHFSSLSEMTRHRILHIESGLLSPRISEIAQYAAFQDFEVREYFELVLSDIQIHKAGK